MSITRIVLSLIQALALVALVGVLFQNGHNISAAIVLASLVIKVSIDPLITVIEERLK